MKVKITWDEAHKLCVYLLQKIATDPRDATYTIEGEPVNKDPLHIVADWLKNFPKQGSSERWYLAVADELLTAQINWKKLK